jgi:hypothetical protein
MRRTNVSDLDGFRKSIIDGLVNGTLGKEEQPVKPAPAVVESQSTGDDGTGDLSGIVEGIIKKRLVDDPLAAGDDLSEARKEAVASIDWDIANDLFGR